MGIFAEKLDCVELEVLRMMDETCCWICCWIDCRLLGMLELLNVWNKVLFVRETDAGMMGTSGRVMGFFCSERRSMEVSSGVSGGGFHPADSHIHLGGGMSEVGSSWSLVAIDCVSSDGSEGDAQT